MKNLSFSNRALLAGVALLSAALACTAPAAQQATEQVTQTQAVAQTTEQPALPTEGVTQPPAAPQVTPSATTATTAGVTPSATTCLYNSVFVADLTIPDGTQIQTGDTFTKTWRIKNNGCQPWPAGTNLIFVSGNQMSGPPSVPVPPTAQNGTQDVSVNLKAPSIPGDYQGYWQLRTPDGTQFGDKVFVKIQAVSPAAPTATTVPAVTITYDASYVGGMWWCTGSPNLYNYTVIIKNTSAVNFESASWNLDAPPGTHVNNGSSNTPFQTTPTAAACNNPALFGSSLAPGDTGWISAFSPNTAIASGTATRIRLTVCTQDNLGGTCKSVTINFTA